MDANMLKEFEDDFWRSLHGSTEARVPTRREVEDYLAWMAKELLRVVWPLVAFVGCAFFIAALVVHRFVKGGDFELFGVAWLSFCVFVVAPPLPWIISKIIEARREIANCALPAGVQHLKWLESYSSCPEVEAYKTAIQLQGRALTVLEVKALAKYGESYVEKHMNFQENNFGFI